MYQGDLAGALPCSRRTREVGENPKTARQPHLQGRLLLRSTRSTTMISHTMISISTHIAIINATTQEVGDQHRVS